MVLMNASSRARHAASVVNQDFKGGNKKAGLPKQVGRTQWMSIHFRQTSQNLAELKVPEVSTVKVSRPISMRYM